MRLYFLLFVNLFFSLSVFSQAKSLKRELRGAWLTTYLNIDWPVRTQTPQQQRNALVALLDQYQQTGINVVYFQVRSQSDAMYLSAIEPWSADLTGTQGVAPNPVWDPLQFVIEECHKRGLELHAWLNPYRAISNYANINTFSTNHVARKNPQWLLVSGALRTLDPGLPAVRDYIYKVIADIVTRYDVDGVHFDDYFYPSGTFNDDATFAAHNRGFVNRDDWRRDNVNLLIKEVSDTVASIKPWVKFGISPSGIYRNSTDPSVGSPTGGMEHYSRLYADSKKWLQEGWVDYLIPQVYWHIGQNNADYSKIVPWWNNNSFGRHIYIGLAGYKVNDVSLNQSAWLQRTQIPNQIRINRSEANANVYGQVVYNTKSMVSNPLNFRDSLALRFYNKPALVPTMPWRDNVAPQAPASLVANKFAADSVVLNWVNSSVEKDEFNDVKKYVVYRSQKSTIDIESVDNILTLITADKTTYTDKTAGSGVYYYVVTALDRFSNESVVSNVVTTLVDENPSPLPPPQENEIIDKVVVYPNPAENEINIRFPENYGKTIDVKIVNTAGKMFYKDRLRLNNQSSVKILLDNKLAAGQYVLLLNKGKSLESFKLLVL